MRNSLFIIIILTSFCSSSIAQNYRVYGVVQETFQKSPLSFVHIIINNGKKEIFSDMDGNFDVTTEFPIEKLVFKHHLHRETEYYCSLQDSMPLLINMNKYLPFFNEDETDAASEAILENVLNNKKNNNIEERKSYSYNTYNKYIFSTEKMDKTNKALNKISKKLSFGLQELKPNQHFLILETVTKRKFLDPLNQNETVIGAKSSSINLPSLYIQTTHIQAFSIYEDEINIIGKAYISPLAKYTLDRYAFKVIDTAYVDQDTVYILQFNPKPKKYFLGTKGFMYINTKKYAVQYIIVGPALESTIEMKVTQSFKNYDQIWFPERTKSMAIVDKFGTRQSKMIGTANTYFYDVNLNNSSLRKKIFNENVLEFKRYAYDVDESFWKSERKELFTESDSNTYLYYDSLVHKKTIEEVLKAGEQIYYGQIPYKWINIDLNKVVNHNLLEGYRFGFGAHTNDEHSERYSVGAYIGYGINDKRFKFGGDLVYHLEKKYELDWRASYAHDVREAGATSFPFENYQYSSEAIRKYLLRIMDYVNELDNSINIHPLKYLKLRFSLTNSLNTPSYAYTYKGQQNNSYNFTDIGLGFRYAFGEKNIRLLNQNLPISGKYPVAYFQFTKGMNNFFNGNYSYTKADFRIDYTINKFLLGKTGLQFLGGITEGNAPYFKLYNMKGSLKSPSVVIHNSFETMRYNEFLADRYVAFFFSHQFGKIYIRKPKISPSFIIMHNMGWGALKNPQNHQLADNPFKTMEKGYFESGMFLDNIIVINLWGLRTGVGTGFFLRYGPYALPNIDDNLVFKLSTTFFAD